MESQKLNPETETWFEKIYREQYKRLMLSALQFRFSATEAEELVQDAFQILLTRAETVRHYDNPEGFLFLTFKNLLGDAIRRQKRIEFTRFEEAYIGQHNDIYFDDIVQHLPEGLEDKDREILLMLLEEHLTYEQMAERLQITVGTCRTRVFRAKERCRALMEKSKDSL